MSKESSTNNNKNNINNNNNNGNIEKEPSSGSPSPKNRGNHSNKNSNISPFLSNDSNTQNEQNADNQEQQKENVPSPPRSPVKSPHKKSNLLKKRKGKHCSKKNIQNSNAEENLLITEVKNEVVVPPKEDSGEVKFLKNKIQTLKIPENLSAVIKSQLEKTKTTLKKDIVKKNIEINENKLSMEYLLKNKKKENENVHKINDGAIIYDLDAITTKQLYHWNKDINFYKNEIIKIEANQKIYENQHLKDIFSKKIFNDKSKLFDNQKNKIFQKIRTISEKIKTILENSKKLNKRQIIKNYSAKNLNDGQEKFNKHLLEIQKNEELNRKRKESDLKLSNEKRLRKFNLDKLKSESQKTKLLKNIKEKDKEFYSKLKSKNDNLLKKYNIFLKKNNSHGIKDYLFYKLQENFENNERKLVEKVNMIKKDPLVTKEELTELSQKIKKQKLLLEESAVEKKNKLLEIWKNREKTLPVYRHPIVDILEDEKFDNLEIQEEKQKQKMNNELGKKNYKPPQVNISKKLKRIRESRNIKTNKENLMKTEINNKNRLINSINILPNIISTSKDDLNKKETKIHDFKSLSETDLSKINKKKRRKKIIKSSEHHLHPKPEKPIDYLKEISVKQHKQKDTDDLLSINKDLKEKNIIGSDVIDRIKMAKSKVELLDQKVGEKKEFLKVAGGYIQNVKLGDEVGNLLIKSIQAKLGIMNKLNGS